MKKIVVLGAGITGVTFANRIGLDRDVVVYEQNGYIGGKCYSYSVESEQGMFVFDIGGHWLHTKSYEDASRMFSELKDHKRHAYVCLLGSLAEFPIQFNYNKVLDKELIQKIDNELEKLQLNNTEVCINYDDMLKKSYGETLYSLFFKDYNEKLFGLNDLKVIDYGSFDLARNVRMDNKKGYNDVFKYPDNGQGINCLVKQIADGVNIKLGKKAVAIYPKEKRVIFDDSEEVKYNCLISTIPLKSFAAMLDGVDKSISEAGKELKASRGIIYNLGAKKNEFHQNKTWVYYPQKDLIFYRVGIYTNVDMKMAPDGYSSIYVECVAKTDLSVVVRDLIRTGFLQSEKDVIVSSCHELEENYCFHSENAQTIREMLQRYNIYSIGRYGSWWWSSIHQDMKQAVDLADRLIL